MAKRLEGKSAIITGAGRGVGEAIARRFSLEGARVMVADINGESARLVAREIDAVPFEVDITREKRVVEMVSAAMDRFQELDIMVCNAAVLISGPTPDFSLADWRRVMSVNLDGYFLCAREAARVMLRQGSGSIIQVNSKSGKKGSARNAAYAASKFAGIGLTQSLALEMAPCRVRVNAICPGNLLDSPLWVESLYDQYARNQGLSREEVRRRYEAQSPMGRSCTYEDVCNVAVFLAGDESSYMTGQAINVTGGQEMR